MEKKKRKDKGFSLARFLRIIILKEVKACKKETESIFLIVKGEIF